MSERVLYYGMVFYSFLDSFVAQSYNFYMTMKTARDCLVYTTKPYTVLYWSINIIIHVSLVPDQSTYISITIFLISRILLQSVAVIVIVNVVSIVLLCL